MLFSAFHLWPPRVEYRLTSPDNRGGKRASFVERQVVSMNAECLLLYFCPTKDNKGNSLSEQSFRCFAQSLLCVERDVHKVRIFKDTCRDKWLG